MRFVGIVLAFITALPALAQTGPIIDGDWEIQFYVSRVEDQSPAEMPIRIRGTVKCRRDKKGLTSRIVTLKDNAIVASKHISSRYDPGTKMATFVFERAKRDPASGKAKSKKMQKSFPVSKDCSEFKHVPGKEPPENDPSQNPFNSNNALPKKGTYEDGESEI